MTRPTTTSRPLLQRDLGDERIVVDVERSEALCLDRLTAFVLDRCDGSSSPEQIARDASGVLGTADSALVDLALTELGRRGLVQGAAAKQPTRRHVNRLLALGIVLPTIASIGLPSPAEAQSNLPNGQRCTSDLQCTSGCCNVNSNRCTNHTPGVVCTGDGDANAAGFSGTECFSNDECLSGCCSDGGVCKEDDGACLPTTLDSTDDFGGESDLWADPVPRGQAPRSTEPKRPARERKPRQ